MTNIFLLILKIHLSLWFWRKCLIFISHPFVFRQSHDHIFNDDFLTKKVQNWSKLKNFASIVLITQFLITVHIPNFRFDYNSGNEGLTAFLDLLPMENYKVSSVGNWTNDLCPVKYYFRKNAKMYLASQTIVKIRVLLR